MSPDLRPEVLLLFPALLFSIICHEVGHAYAAYKGGDDTARLQGRLTLNPLAHIDPIGTVVMPILQLLWGIPLIGWAKPVPVDPSRLRSRRWDVIVSLAGVTMNFGLILIASVLLRILFWTIPESFLPLRGSVTFPWAIVTLLQSFVMINLILIIFNLIPIPPLDGSHILLHMIKTRDSVAFQVFQFLERFGFMILLLLVFTGVIRYLFIPVALVLLGALGFIFQMPIGALIPIG